MLKNKSLQNTKSCVLFNIYILISFKCKETKTAHFVFSIINIAQRPLEKGTLGFVERCLCRTK